MRGRISALFDISHGFEHDASGWDNILYRGYLQGETPRSMQGRLREIAEFSELGHFLDMPALFEAALKRGFRAKAYQLDGYWLDIGRLPDFARANSEFHNIFSGIP